MLDIKNRMRMMLFTALLAGTATAGQGDSKGNTAEELSRASSELAGETRDYVVGNLLYILLHEMGDAIIRDFDVPLLGLEEDSADTIATITLIRVD